LHQLQVMTLLRTTAHQGRGVIVVLHDLALAARFCDRLVLLVIGLPLCFVLIGVPLCIAVWGWALATSLLSLGSQASEAATDKTREITAAVSTRRLRFRIHT
jgi:energy-coupling factor transporter ATP-binding protein EcfA2